MKFNYLPCKFLDERRNNISGFFDGTLGTIGYARDISVFFPSSIPKFRMELYLRQFYTSYNHKIYKSRIQNKYNSFIVLGNRKIKLNFLNKVDAF